VIDRILGVVTAACITALLATRPKPLIAHLTSSKSTLRNHGLGRIDRLDQTLTTAAEVFPAFTLAHRQELFPKLGLP
jgi:hypothetical protein